MIETIPGIDTFLAATIIGEIGGIHRFTSARMLAAHAQIGATVGESGKFTGSENRTSARFG
ncbi:MAG TPA: hypothetical protein DCQ13_04800 [Firmicutes bacterium]|nr:IS110 family transposase [Bacillota bacterium]HAN86947.1 hypothetical protein [Bacillota bacterium]